MNHTDPAPIRPRVACPRWCDFARDDEHTGDYTSTTAAGLLARIHSTTVTAWGRYAVDLTAVETAQPDGAAPLVDPPTIAAYGLEDGPELSAVDARRLADALRAAAERLDHLDAEAGPHRL